RLNGDVDDLERTLRDSVQENAGLKAQVEVMQSQAQKLEQSNRQLEFELGQVRQVRGHLQARWSELETELRQERVHHEEKLRLLGEARERLTHEFKSLATQILDENSQKFAEQNRSNLDTILQPLKVQLTDFRQKVEETYDKEA